jgi:DNA-binding transcriptional ArsR family regulator
MRNHSKQPTSDEPALRQAVRHPKRLEILGYLAEKRVGVDETVLANALDLSLLLVKYHLRILQSADLVVSVDRDPGASERYIAA